MNKHARCKDCYTTHLPEWHSVPLNNVGGDVSDDLREKTRRSIALLVAQRHGADKWGDEDYAVAGNILFVCGRLITQYGNSCRTDELEIAESKNVITRGMNGQSYYAIDPDYKADRTADLTTKE